MKIYARLGIVPYILTIMLIAITMAGFETAFFFEPLLGVVIVLYFAGFIYTLLNAYYILEEEEIFIRLGFIKKRIRYDNIESYKRGMIWNKSFTSISKRGVVLKLKKSLGMYKTVVIASRDDDEVERMLDSKIY